MSGPIHCKVLEVGDLLGDGKLAGVVLTMAREDVRRFGAHLYADIVVVIDEDGDMRADTAPAVEDAKVAAEQDARREVDPPEKAPKAKREQERGEPIAKAGTDLADLVRQAVALLAFDKTAILAGGTIRDSLEVPPWRWSRVLEELRHHGNVRRTGVGPGVRYQWREADR